MTIKANETSAVLEVQTRDNATYGANPEVVVRLAEAFGGDTGTGQVADDEAAPTYSISDAMVAEGGKLLFTVSSSAPVASDTLVETVGHGSVTIKANETSAVLEVQTRDNATYGANPEVVVRLAEAFGGDTGTGQVADDDDPILDPPVVTIGDGAASEADGTINLTVTLSHPSAQDVTLTYEVSAPGKVIGFDGTGAIHSAIPAGYEGLRWTGIASSGDGGALTATTGGGQIQALNPSGLSVSSLTVSSASTNQVVTIQAIKDGTVVGTETVTLGNGGPSSVPVNLGAAFSGIDALRIDGSANSFGDDWPVRIDNVVLSGGDPNTGTFTISAGQTSGSIVIPVANDSLYEVGEAFTVRLTDAQGATLGSDIEATGSITNDDAAPLPMVSITNVFTKDVGEGLIQEFEVTRDARVDEALTVQFESALFGNQAVDFKPGETKVWATFGKADDQIAEPNQPYEITLAPGAGYVLGAVTSVSGMYIDNDGGTLNTAPTASSSVSYIQEGDFATYGGSYSLAAYGFDDENDKLTYSLVGEQPEAGTISFDPDVGAGALMFTPHKDFLDSLDKGEQAEFTYQFTVSDGEFTTAPVTGNVIVFGDGLAPGALPEVSVTTADVTEGGAITYTLARTGSTAAPLSVTYTLGGTATSGSDYTAPAPSATFAAGSATATVTVRTTNDTAVESAETVVLTLNADAGYTIAQQGTATSTIADNDATAPSLPTISVTDVTVTEGGNLNFRFPMSAASAERLTVAYEIVYGTATADDVTFAQTGTFFIAAGQANRGLNVLTIDDALPEGAETFTFRITSVTTNSGAPGATIVDGEATGTVTDNDQPTLPPPTLPTLSISNADVIEGDTATFTVTLSAPSTSPVTVTWGTQHQSTNADDLPLAGGSLTFEPGQTTRTIAVATTEDTVVEEADRFRVLLSEPVGATLANATGVGTISNDDQAQPPATAPGIINDRTGGPLQVAEGGANATFTIALASAPTADVTVMVEGDYFQVASNPDDPYGAAYLTFTPNNWNVPQAVTVTALDDLDPEEAGVGGLYISTIDSADPRYNYLFPENGYLSVSVTDNDSGDVDNTAPSALAVTKDTYDTHLSVDVEGFGYDTETGDTVTYELLSQPAEGTVTLLPDGRTFRFEGNAELLDALSRGEIKPVTFQYRVSDGELISEPATITVNVHGTNPGDETIQAFTRTTPSQTDFFPLDGGDGNDTVVFNSVTLTSGTGLEISLGKTIKWTEYDGKPIANIENITIKDTNGNLLRTMTVGGDDQGNVIAIENTNHKLTILGRGGDDTVNFKGTGNGLTSVVNGGAGDDTVNAYSTVTVNVVEGNDTVNVFSGSNVTVQNFTQGDKINFSGGLQASNVSAAVQGTNTVLTVNQGGVTNTVTVVDATGLMAGTDWTADGTAAPPPAGEPVINAVSAPAEVTEGSVAAFTFTRTGDLSQPLTVAIDTSVGSAVPGQDFTAPANLTFAAGSATAVFEVQTLNDAVAEDPATIEVRIVPGIGYTVGAADGNVADLIDNGDAGPAPVLPSLSINDVEVNEDAGTASFTVTLSAVAATAVSVDYATGLASGAADAFAPKSGTLTFAPGETTKAVEIDINDNGTVATGPQKLVVNLSNVTGSATLADLVGEGTILDDDLPTEMPALTIATTTGLNENSTLSWNAIPGAASYVLIGIEPDEPNFPPHTLGFAVAPNTSFAIKGNDEFTGMVVTVEARDASGNPIARSENQTEVIENVNDVPTGRPVISDNTPEVGQLLTISIGDLEDGDGIRADRPDEFGYVWQRSTDGVTWSLIGSTDSYQVTAADVGYLIRGGAQYADRGDTLETVFSLVTAKVGDPNPNTPPVAFDDTATTSVGKEVAISVLTNDFDFEGDAQSIEAYGQGAHGSVTAAGDQLVYTPNAAFVGTDTFTYTLNGGDTAKVAVTVTQPEAGPLTLQTVDNLDENSTLSWSAVPGAVSYVLIGLEPDDPTAPPHELGFALAPSTSFNINGDDEFAGMAIHVEARDGNGITITRSVNETGVIENINDVPTGNLSLSDMTPEVGQALTLGYGTFADGDGYRDRGRPEEFEWSWQRSQDGVTWTTITTGQTYTVTQADNGSFIRGRAIYEDRAGDTIETVYSLTTGRVGAPQPGEDGSGGGGTDGGDEEINFGSLIIAHTGGSTTITEGAATDTFTVQLADAPTSDVTVQVSTGNPFYALGSELVFTPENWDKPQTVTVAADDDFVREVPEASAVSFYATSEDPRYNDLMPDDLPVTINDGVGEPDPIPFVSVAYLGGDVTEGGEITFDFMRRESINTDSMNIAVQMAGLDESDIETIRWNGVENGVSGFLPGAATATMTLVLADDAVVEGAETLNLTVVMTADYLDDFDNLATVTVLDNDVVSVNTKPVVETRSVELSEDQMTAEIKPVVTDAEADQTAIKVVGVLPTYVTFDESKQSFLFNGEASAFNHLSQGEKAPITFQYVANDGTEDSDPGTITININGITDETAPQVDPEPAEFTDPYNYDQGNGGPAGQRTAGDDILNDGEGQSSTIQGLGGNDTIYGRDGNDILLVGGNGNDTVYGGSGNDIINGDGGGTTNNPGGPGSDWLYGGDGVDTINGQDGNDTIVGGHGADNLTGGLGDDTFVFHDIFDRGDTITMQGQQAANDVFDFRSFDFDPNTAGTQDAVNGLQLFSQAPVAGQMLEDAFYYDRASGKLSLNTGTDGMEDFSVTLLVGAGTTMPQVNTSDFLI
ncbi:Calx-beta domain-containing protein [Roseomonas chloroacetimidivorans]|uniref:Calx-beta domain-containing protein n=1 Tax=Roseomonas chloroacetimidivorans TaxID=1766656 RepID=UPI003C769065